MKKQKILSLLLILALLLGVLGVPAALAEGGKKIHVNLRVEGLDKCLYVSENIGVTPFGDNVTLADFVKAMASVPDFPKVTLESGEYGAYIADIDGLAQASHGEMSGWLFRINGELATVGMSGYELFDGDDIVIFFSDLYGAGMQFPIVDSSRLLTDGVLKFTSEDTVYDEDWNETVETRPITGATVKFDNESMITDGNGEISVPQHCMLAGLHLLQIEKFDEQTGAPLVLRYAPDYKTFVPYADMDDGAWYTEAVEYCVRNGLFAGMGENTFAPNGYMTMAQLVTVLSRIAGARLTAEPDQPWFTAAMNWAIDSGVIHDSGYSPNAEVSREIFIYMFYKTAALDGKTDMHTKSIIIEAEDYDEISEPYIGAIEWAVASGLIVGTGAGHSKGLTIDPAGLVSRAVVCQMLARYYA